MAERVDGSCLCGKVQFHVELPTLYCVHCHCSMCRRSNGAAYATWFTLPTDQFEIDAGADVLIHYDSSDHGSRRFCGRCGSSLFCESKHHPDQVDIPLTTMHAPIDREPELHIYFDDRADWTAVTDDLPKLGGESGMEPIQSEE